MWRGARGSARKYLLRYVILLQGNARKYADPEYFDFSGRHISMTTTLILLSIILITHVCRRPLKLRAQRVDGSAAGLMSALIFTLLSVAQLVATLLAVISVIF